MPWHYLFITVMERETTMHRAHSASDTCCRGRGVQNDDWAILWLLASEMNTNPYGLVPGNN